MLSAQVEFPLVSYTRLVNMAMAENEEEGCSPRIAPLLFISQIGKVEL